MNFPFINTNMNLSNERLVDDSRAMQKSWAHRNRCGVSSTTSYKAAMQSDLIQTKINAT